MLIACGVGVYEEAGPPIDIADRIGASFPNHLMKLIHQQLMKRIIQIDKSVHTPAMPICNVLIERLDVQGNPRRPAEGGIQDQLWRR